MGTGSEIKTFYLLKIFTMKIQKFIKIIISIITTVVISCWIIYAWNGLIALDGDSLTHTKWNELVNKILPITSTWWKVGIWITNPQEKLDIQWNIKISSNWESVIISVDTWNDILKNINKKWYRFWTYNTTDVGHYWYWSGLNFDNCEIVEYFQVGETIANTYVGVILSNNLWNDNSKWSINLNHDKFLRDFNLNSSYNNPNQSNYGFWATVKYWPSRLERCSID